MSHVDTHDSDGLLATALNRLSAEAFDDAEPSTADAVRRYGVNRQSIHRYRRKGRSDFLKALVFISTSANPFRFVSQCKVVAKEAAFRGLSTEGVSLRLRELLQMSVSVWADFSTLLLAKETEPATLARQSARMAAVLEEIATAAEVLAASESEGIH